MSTPSRKPGALPSEVLEKAGPQLTEFQKHMLPGYHMQIGSMLPSSRAASQI